MGSSWGNLLRVSIFGESHGPMIGVVIEGLPSGLRIDEEFIALQMKRRAPGRADYATARQEADLPRIVSGALDGRVTGAPLCALIENADTRSGDYDELRRLPRPSHADYPALLRYGGHADPRGGGHFSGRLTAPLVFAGALARLALRGLGIEVYGRIASIAGIDDSPFPPLHASDRSAWEAVAAREFPVCDPQAEAAMRGAIDAARSQGDSVGGIVDIAAFSVPGGWGDPMFGGLESRIASIVYGVPAVKGVSFGSGFGMTSLRGSQANDAYILSGDAIETRTNHNGGILGGIATGMPIVFHAAIKPTPSIALPQETIDVRAMKAATLSVRGRHDPCIVPRAVPVLESAAAIALLDVALEMEGRFLNHKFLDEGIE